MVAQEEAELHVLQAYLPPQMPADEIEAIARSIIEQVGAHDSRDMGKVMPKVMAQVSGRADGQLVSTIVRELLSHSQEP